MADYLCPICSTPYIARQDGDVTCSTCYWPISVSTKTPSEHFELVCAWGRRLRKENKVRQQRIEKLQGSAGESYARHVQEVEKLKQAIEVHKRDNVELLQKNTLDVGNNEFSKPSSQTTADALQILLETQFRVEAVKAFETALTEGQLLQDVGLFEEISPEELLSVMAAINNCFNRLHTAAFSSSSRKRAVDGEVENRDAQDDVSDMSAQPNRSAEVSTESELPEASEPIEPVVQAESVYWLGEYNQSRVSLKAHAIEASFTQQNIEQRRTGQENSVLLTASAGPLWIIGGEEGAAHCYLVPKASHRFNQYSIDSFKGCFDFHNSKGGADYIVHAPALVVLLPEGNTWKMVKKGQISFVSGE